MNLLFVSAIEGVGRTMSIDRRTGGSGGAARFSTILFLKSPSSRLGGSPGRSSGKSLAERMWFGRVFFTGCIPIRASDGGNFSAMEWCLGGGGK